MTTLVVYTAASADDADDSGITDALLAINALNSDLGFRFVDIPLNATNATLVHVGLGLWNGGTYSQSPVVTVTCEDADDAAQFASNDLPADRTDTTASVSWDLSESKGAYDDSWIDEAVDLKDCVAEVFARGGWAAGNALVVLTTTTSADPTDPTQATVVSADSTAQPAHPPRLTIEYTPVLADIDVYQASETNAGTAATATKGQVLGMAKC